MFARESKSQAVYENLDYSLSRNPACGKKATVRGLAMSIMPVVKPRDSLVLILLRAQFLDSVLKPSETPE